MNFNVNIPLIRKLEKLGAKFDVVDEGEEKKLVLVSHPNTEESNQLAKDWQIVNSRMNTLREEWPTSANAVKCKELNHQLYGDRK